MVKQGFKPSADYIEQKYKLGKITRKDANRMLEELRKNYRNGTARKELENTGIKNYRDY